MNSPKNIAFTRLIKINGRLREFNFRKRPSGHYDVNTSDERGNRFFFKVEPMDGEWNVAADNELPAWLTNNKNLIIGAIGGEE